MGMGNSEKSDNPYASKLDVLAAAASEAAGKPQTPATSVEVTASVPTAAEAAAAAAAAEDEAGPSHAAHADAIAESKRTPSKRPRSSAAPAAKEEDAEMPDAGDGNAAAEARAAYPSPGMRSPGNPYPFLSPGTAGKQLLSPGNRNFGLGAEDLLGHNLQLDLQALDNQQEGVLDLLREQGVATEDLAGNLSEFNSPFGTPNSLLQARALARVALDPRVQKGCWFTALLKYCSIVPTALVPFIHPFFSASWQSCRGCVASMPRCAAIICTSPDHYIASAGMSDTGAQPAQDPGRRQCQPGHVRAAAHCQCCAARPVSGAPDLQF